MEQEARMLPLSSTYCDSATVEQALSELEGWIAANPKPAASGLTAAGAEGFLRWVARYMQESIGVELAFVAEVIGEDWDRVQTLSVVREGQPLPNFDYDLFGTPCARVVAQDICVYRYEVAKAFPTDEMLVGMGIEAYVGVSLMNEAGAPLGLMALLDTKPISEETVARACACLQIFRARVQEEMSSRNALRSLELAVAGPRAGDSEIDHLTAALARAMHSRICFASVPRQNDANRAWTLSLIVDGVKEKNIEYELRDWPCNELLRHSTWVVPSGLRDTYPALQASNIKAEAFVGVAVRDGDGNAVGHIGLLHDREISRDIVDRPLFRILSSQAAAELRRICGEEKRRGLEEKLVQSQRRESLGVLAGGVAHDFNNMLLVIASYADMVVAGRHGNMSVSELGTEILSATKQASHLCRQLLVYTGKSEPERTIADLCQVVRVSSSLTRMMGGARAHRIYDISDEPISVLLAVSPIQQVVTNLVKNAADSLDGAEGTIRVEVKVQDVKEGQLDDAIVGSELPPGRYACLAIEDDGPGMDAATLARIFEPFYSTKPGGQGLGLAAVEGLVASHGGALRVDSHPGMGARFEIFFPLVEGLPETEAQSPGSESAAEGLTILVVDDNDLVRTAVCTMIQSGGMNVLSASSGQEALDLYAEKGSQIDFVLLDYFMPDMNGAEVLRALREKSPSVRVLLCSGADGVELGELDEKPDGVLPKPFRLEDLYTSLAAIMGG